MGKLTLIMLFGMGAALYFPDSRQAIMDKAMPVLVPVLEWSAKGEMDKIARSVQLQDRLQRRVPSRRAWLPYLEENFSADAGLDPWGSLYQFAAWRDSFAIISYGADRERGTDDDISKVLARSGG
jgi:Type II secretion system (T2SS), protein G